MFKMKEEYKTGIEIIDQQHTVIFEIADEAYHILKDEYTFDKYDKITKIVERLKEYSFFHFQTEEMYMEKVGHKKRFTQKIEHMKFIDKFNEINLTKIDENQKEYLLDMLKFLNDWLVSHILEKDMLIGK